MLHQSKIDLLQKRLADMQGLKDEVFSAVKESSEGLGANNQMRTVEIFNTLDKAIKNKDLSEIAKANEQLNEFRDGIHNK